MRPEARVIRSPADPVELRSLSVGDVFYLSGVIATSRDRAYARILLEGRPPPFDLEGKAVLHAGPAVRREGESWRITSMGPTTSARLDELHARFIEATKAALLVGKGGVSPEAGRALASLGAIYAEMPGGLGALGASSVRRVIGVEWLDLGVTEAVWLLEVERLGPLVVSVDSTGRNLREENEARLREAGLEASRLMASRLGAKFKR